MKNQKWVKDYKNKNNDQIWGVLECGVFKPRIKCGKSIVDDAVKKWHVFSMTRVATPNSEFFQSPICQPELELRAHKGMLTKLKINLSIFGLAACASLLNLVLNPNLKNGHLFLLLATISLYLLFEYFVLSSKENSKDRSKYYIWAYEETKLISLISFFAVVSIYIVQLYVIKNLGSLNDLIQTYGAVFTNLRHDPWRLLTGPFIHSGFIHAISNAAMLPVALSISLQSASLRNSIAVLFISTIFSYIVVSINATVDAMVGISPGIYGLFGFGVTFFYLNRKYLPKHLWLSLLAFVFVNLMIANLLSENVSNLSHLCGLIFGSLIALIYRLKTK